MDGSSVSATPCLYLEKEEGVDVESSVTNYEGFIRLLEMTHLPRWCPHPRFWIDMNRPALKVERRWIHLHRVAGKKGMD